MLTIFRPPDSARPFEKCGAAAGSILASAVKRCSCDGEDCFSYVCERRFSCSRSSNIFKRGSEEPKMDTAQTQRDATRKVKNDLGYIESPFLFPPTISDNLRNHQNEVNVFRRISPHMVPAQSRLDDTVEDCSKDFVVELTRISGSILGLEVNCRDGKTFLVKGVSWGMFQAYNSSVDAGKRIKKGDRIIEINGICADVKKMLEPVLKSEKLTFVIRRTSVAFLQEDVAKHAGIMSFSMPEKAIAGGQLVEKETGDSTPATHPGALSQSTVCREMQNIEERFPLQRASRLARTVQTEQGHRIQRQINSVRSGEVTEGASLRSIAANQSQHSPLHLKTRRENLHARRRRLYYERESFRTWDCRTWLPNTERGEGRRSRVLSDLELRQRTFFIGDAEEDALSIVDAERDEREIRFVPNTARGEGRRSRVLSDLEHGRRTAFTGDAEEDAFFIGHAEEGEREIRHKPLASNSVVQCSRVDHSVDSPDADFSFSSLALDDVYSGDWATLDTGVNQGLCTGDDVSASIDCFDDTCDWSRVVGDCMKAFPLVPGM